MKVKLRKLEASLSSTLDRVFRGAATLAAVLLVTWVFVFVGSIIARNWFHVYISYLEEYTGYWVLIITCLVLAYTLRMGGHVRADVIIMRFPQRVRDIVEILVTVAALAMSYILIAESGKILLYAISENIHSYMGTEALLWPVYLWIPIGYGLLFVALLLHLFRSILAILSEE